MQTLFDLSDANAREIEQFIEAKFGKIITANTDKKNHIIITDEINIETCYRSGCLVLQNKKMVAEIIGDQ